MSLPLLPLAFELWHNHTIKQETLSLAASMYAISIGMSSRSKLLFGLTLAISIFYSVIFGIQSSAGNQPGGQQPALANVAIALVFVVHACERYNRHVVGRAPFWEFPRANADEGKP
jgi:uncharacterized membrane protein